MERERAVCNGLDFMDTEERTPASIPPEDEVAQRYTHDRVTAQQAQLLAEQIAFGPVLFQTARVLLRRGTLESLAERADGYTLPELAQKAELSEYAMQVVLESALTAGIVLRRGNRWLLGKVGWFLLRSAMTRVNINFVHDVCYQGLFSLEESLEEGRPVGLEHFGTWDTIYQGLSQLPATVLESWLAFDHYYSDQSFGQALSIVFARPVHRLLDVGGNTGRWALRCVQHSPDVRVTIMDLPGQLGIMQRQVAQLPGGDRIDGYAADMLDTGLRFPKGYDAVWMSQFLDCFSVDDAQRIVVRAAESMAEDSRLYILEPLWDRQRYETASFSQTQISPYFTTMANGCSKLFDSGTLLGIVARAGLELESMTDGLGVGHSLLCCRLKG